MNILTKLFSNQEFCELPTQGYITITADDARSILALLDAVLPFVADLDKRGLASRFFSVHLGSGEKIPAFVPAHLPFASDADKEFAVLPETFDPSAISDDDTPSMECHRLCVRECGVSFSSLERHGSATLTTPVFTREWLQAIADGTELTVPAAVIAEE